MFISKRFLAWAMGLALVAAAVVLIPALTKSAEAGFCPNTPEGDCPYSDNGTFIGFSNPWPPNNCIYLVKGLTGMPSGTIVGGGRPVYSGSDRSASKTAPLCRPRPVPNYRFPYYERGSRTNQVGAGMSIDGCVNKFNPDGSPLGRVCFNMSGSGYGEGGTGSQTQAQVIEEASFTLGWIDQVTCDGIEGWAYDSDNPTAEITVHFYVDGKAGTGKLLTSGVTNIERADINEAFNMEGRHAFKVQLPDTVRDGKNHTIYAYGIDTNGGENRSLANGGKTFNCTGATGVVSTNPTAVPVVDVSTPTGWLDSVNCTEFRGWAFDPDNAAAVLDIHFYKDAPAGKGGVLIGSTRTNILRDDVNSLYKITGNHGFTFRHLENVGSPVGDGKPHAVYAYAINTNQSNNPQLGGTPKSVTCAATTTTGGTPGSTPGTVTGGGGGSNRHTYLSPCNGSGLAQAGDPGIAVVAQGDGSAIVTVAGTGYQVNGKVPTGPFTAKSTDVINVTNGSDAYKFTADVSGMNAADAGSMSNLIPMPCIRIGYNDVRGGDLCGSGEGGTCANKLHVFCGPGAWENNYGFNTGSFEIWMKIDGKSTPDYSKWTKYPYQSAGLFSSTDAVQVEGKGTVYCMTVFTKDGVRSSSLVATKTFEVVSGNFE